MQAFSFSVSDRNKTFRTDGFPDSQTHPFTETHAWQTFLESFFTETGFSFDIYVSLY